MATTAVLTMVTAWIFASAGTMFSALLLLHINRVMHSTMIDNIDIGRTCA